MPLKFVLQNPRAGLIIGNFFAAIIANAVTFNIPLYFQAVLLESATTSGLRLIVPSLASSAIGTATGFLITWTKRLKWLLVLGVICLVTGTVGLSSMQRGLPDWAYMLFLVPSAMGQGFIFPATFMSVLAVSEQSEQAVVTSTLILWRSLGMVLGVATSSLVVQNALRVYLEKNVVGPDKEDVSWLSSGFYNQELTERIGYPTSSQIRKSNCGSGANVQGASYRFVCFGAESDFHYDSGFSSGRHHHHPFH
jgi:hypothetical protein